MSASALFGQAPTITAQPQNRTVITGQYAVFAVTVANDNGNGGAGGAPSPFGFQWQVNTGSGFTDLGLATFSSYTPPPATMAMNGYQYRVLVTDPSTGASTMSSVATLTVQVPGGPIITSQPVAQSVTAGQTATFSVIADGTAPLAYQWRRNGVPITSATANTYQLQAALGDSGTVFSVVVSNGIGTATSTNATLTVQPVVAPSITGQPASRTVAAGLSAQFSVTATGSAPLGYQWRKGGVLIPGATASTYTLASVVAADAGSYDVVVSNAAGSVTSAAATLAVTAPITVSVSPVMAYLGTGDAVAFAATVSGTTNAAVTWTVQEGTAGGTVTTAGVYTAPGVPGLYHVLATSQADPSKSAMVTVRVTPKTCLPNA